MVVLAAGMARLEPRDSVPHLDPLDQVLLYKQLQYAIDARPSRRAATGA